MHFFHSLDPPKCGHSASEHVLKLWIWAFLTYDLKRSNKTHTNVKNAQIQNLRTWSEAEWPHLGGSKL